MMNREYFRLLSFCKPLISQILFTLHYGQQAIELALGFSLLMDLRENN